MKFIGWIPYDQIGRRLIIADIGIAMRSKNKGNEYVVTSPWLQYSALGIPCVVSRRQVFTDMHYPYQFDNSDELKNMIYKLLKEPKSWQEYVAIHHDARKVAKEIWSLLLSWDRTSLKN